MASGRNNSRPDLKNSIDTIWEKTYDPIGRSVSIAPFATVESFDSIDEDSIITDEYSDNDGDDCQPITRDESFHSLPPVSGSDATTTASQSTFVPSEPWLRVTPLKFLKIITNGTDDVKEAKRRLRQDLDWDNEEETGPHPWRLGLTLTALEFKSSKLIHLRSLIELSSKTPYWLKWQTEEIFGKRPKHRDMQRNKRTLQFQQSEFKFSLSYGALTNLNQFFYSPENIWTDQHYHKCLIFMHDRSKRSSDIDWTFQDRSRDRVSNRLSLINIKECVIIDLLDDGFAIYFEQICNMSDYKGSISQDNKSNPTHQRFISRTHSETHNTSGFHHGRMDRSPRMQSLPKHDKNQRDWVNYDKYKREGRKMNSFFPTVRFSVQHKNSTRKHRADIEKALSLFIQLFYAQDITICFGKIQNKMGPKPYKFVQQYPPEFLKGFLMRYGWHMLLTSGYRFYLLLDEKLRDHFERIVKDESNLEELFYRISIYLTRVLLIRPFINMHETLNNFEREFRRKKDANSYAPASLFETENSNWQYIPSVTITPTVLRVNPLKLCKTNRVVRDEFIGNALNNFVLVDVREENGEKLRPHHFRDLRKFLLEYLEDGFPLAETNRQYCYLHHTQSQLRQQQFWFYHGTRTLDEIYKYLGDFSNERNPAKYAARMAQCFSTTKQTIQVPSDNVKRIMDIYTTDGKLMFSDGCGTISVALRDIIKESLNVRAEFSVIQLRYAGVKGVVSVDTRLTGQINMNLRKSMIKFECPNHSYFEVCKLSAPRPAFLNRQAILLLSNRKIPDSIFLILQQRNYLSLIRHLLRNSDAQRCIFDKIPLWLLPPDIDRAHLDYIHEPFFRQLLINATTQAARDLLNRTRIRLPPNLGRYMFGIVDEYNVLKPGEVFIQYTVLEDYDSSMLDEDRVKSLKVVKNRDVVITKNPCHHPGDVRRFKAADYPELRHLKDVLVFSQQGDRPPAHDISGSDLDGDEYLVLWHADLVPSETENFPPYDFDSGIPAMEVKGEMSRKIINETILNIAELDCLGSLSKLHLAFADKFGVNDKRTLDIAEAISLELDSAKTGYHPKTNEQINQLSSKLDKKRPDFFNDSNFESYRSEQILGQLYRASKRTLREWNRLFRYHRHLRHLEIRTHDSDSIEEEALENSEDMKITLDESIFADIDFQHPYYRECAVFATRLALIYRAEMLEILNLYGLTHESDIWCQNSTKSSGELEDTAFTELCQLVRRTRTMLYHFQVIHCENNCAMDIAFDQLCNKCKRAQRSVAVACYKICYEDASANPQAAPILSLPWIFSFGLLQNRLQQSIPRQPVLSTAIAKMLNSLIRDRRYFYLTGTHLRFRKSEKSVTPIIVDIEICAFIETLQQTLKNINQTNWFIILKDFIMMKCKENSLSKRISSDDGWELVFDRHRINESDEYAALILSLDWNTETDEEIHGYFDELINICFERYRKTNDLDFFNISEKIVLLLQKLVIDETLI